MNHPTETKLRVFAFESDDDADYEVGDIVDVDYEVPVEAEILWVRYQPPRWEVLVELLDSEELARDEFEELYGEAEESEA